MKCLEERLDSFKKWPLQSPTADELAHHGFYYDPTSKNNDRVACHLCSVAVFNWKSTDTPLDRHRQAYCECPLVTIYSQQSYPLKHEVRQARKNTFGKWWPYQKPYAAMPFNLAQAGFVYSPSIKLHDQVECLYCHVKIADWRPEEEPLVQHQRQSPECPFILEFNGDAKMVKSPSQTSMNGIYSPKLRGSKIDVSYKLTKQEGETQIDDVPSKRGPGRPRKNPLAIQSVKQTLQEEIDVPIKKRKFDVKEDEHSIMQDTLSKFKQLTNEFEQRLNKLNDTTGHSHVNSGIVDQLSEQKQRLEEKVASQSKEIVELRAQLKNQNVRMDDGHAYQVTQLKRDLKDALDEIAVIKKENVKLKQIALQSQSKSLKVRGAALQTLPVSSRRMWYQDEFAIFEGRLGIDGDSYVQSLVEAKPGPFVNCLDIPWPVAPAMSGVQTITMPMISSFLMSDLSKTDFDGFCQWLVSKFNEDAVANWLQYVTEKEREQVVQKSKDIWQCLNEAMQL